MKQALEIKFPDDWIITLYTGFNNDNHDHKILLGLRIQKSDAPNKVAVSLWDYPQDESFVWEVSITLTYGDGSEGFYILPEATIPAGDNSLIKIINDYLYTEELYSGLDDEY